MAVNEEQLFTEWLEQSGFGKSPESKKTADAVERVVRDVGKATRGVGEGLLSMGTSFGGMPIVGLSGMAESGFGINPQRGVDWMQKISPHFAYQPHTEEGRIAAEKMAVPFEMLDRLFQWPSNKVVQGARKAGITDPDILAALGTAAYIGPQIALPGGLLKGAKGLKNVAPSEMLGLLKSERGSLGGRQGASYEKYKKAGEVFRDIDNNDRYEISNANDKLNIPPRERWSKADPRTGFVRPVPHRLTDVYKSDLYNEYPGLFDSFRLLMLNDEDMPPAYRSVFREKGSGFTNTHNQLMALYPEEGPGMPDALRDIFTHEIQHPVQVHEGWGRGGDPRGVYPSGMVRKVMQDEWQNILNAQEKIVAYRGGNRAVPTLRELQEMASVQELSDVINNYLEAVSAQRSLLMGRHEPVYWKLLGEEEARRVTARRKLAPDELRSLGRFWGSDIPDRNQLLVLNSQPRAYSTGLLGRRK